MGRFDGEGGVVELESPCLMDRIPTCLKNFLL